MQENPIKNLMLCCALGFVLSILIGLGEIALEIWLVLHYTSLAGLTGIMIYISYAFLASGGLASLTGLLGLAGVVKMSRCTILLSLPLILLSIICQSGAWTATYLEHIQVVGDLPDRLNGSTQFYKTVDFHYNCQLQNSSMKEFEVQLGICASYLSRQLWIYMYSLLGLCISLICLQCILMLVAAKLSLKIKRLNMQVDPIPQELDDDTRYEPPPNYTPTPRPSTVSHLQLVQNRHQAPLELYSITQPLPPTEQPLPTAPLPPGALQRTTSAPGPRPLSHPYHHSTPNFDLALLPDISQRGNFNDTTPLPSIPSYGEQYQIYQQGNAPEDYVIYEQSRM